MNKSFQKKTKIILYSLVDKLTGLYHNLFTASPQVSWPLSRVLILGLS